MPPYAKRRNKNVCKCDKRAKTSCAWARAQQIFRSTIRPEQAGKMTSGVLLRAQVALVFQPFLTRAALVVIPVWRCAGRRAVLLRRVRTYGWIARAAGWALVALRMTRRAPQCGMSHDGRLQGKASTRTGFARDASP